MQCNKLKNQSSSLPFICENKADEMSVVTKKTEPGTTTPWRTHLHEDMYSAAKNTTDMCMCVHWFVDRTVSKVMWPRSNGCMCACTRAWLTLPWLHYNMHWLILWSNINRIWNTHTQTIYTPYTHMIQVNMLLHVHIQNMTILTWSGTCCDSLFS